MRQPISTLSTAPSESHRTLQTIEQFHDAFNQHDVDAIMALMTETCVFENTYPPPDGSRLEGQTQVRDFWVQFFRESPHAHFEIEELFTCETRAVLRWRYTWQDLSQGLVGHVRGVDIFTVHNGQVSEKLSYVKG